MKTTLKKLFTGNNDDAYRHIIEQYQKKGWAIVNYLYFANIVGKHLFDDYKSDVDKSQFKEALRDDYKDIGTSVIASAYKQALLDSDALLPDGIALQVFYYLAAKRKIIQTPKPRLDNLNGTDFSLFFLERLLKEYSKNDVELYLYGTHSSILEKTKAFLNDKGFDIAYAQDGFTNFDWEQASKIHDKNKKKYAVLLVARTTPEYPIQELWAWSNKEEILKNKFLVLNQGGTFDFRAGIQKRAPKLLRTCKLEWLWRLMTDPKRNYKKVLDTMMIIKYTFLYLLLKKR